MKIKILIILYILLLSCSNEVKEDENKNFTWNHKYIKSLGFYESDIVSEVKYFVNAGDSQHFLLHRDTVLLTFYDTTKFDYYDSLKAYVNSKEIKNSALKEIPAFHHQSYFYQIKGYPDLLIYSEPYASQGFLLDCNEYFIYNIKTNKLNKLNLWFNHKSKLFANINGNGKVNILALNQVNNLSLLKKADNKYYNKDWAVFEAEILELNQDGTLDTLDHDIRKYLFLVNTKSHKMFRIE